MRNIITAGCLIITLTMGAGMLTGCANTANGVGQDMQRAGEKIQETF